MLNNLFEGVRTGVLGFELCSDEKFELSSGEKSERSSRVNIGGGGRSEVAKFSRHKAETAAA